jgi:hypothetical protein
MNDCLKKSKTLVGANEWKGQKNSCRVNGATLKTTRSMVHSNSMIKLIVLSDLSLGFSQCDLKEAILLCTDRWFSPEQRFYVIVTKTFFFSLKKFILEWEHVTTAFKSWCIQGK